MQRPSGPFGQPGVVRPERGAYEEKLHLEEFCAACKHGVCVYIMKAQKKKEREERQVEYEEKRGDKPDGRGRGRGDRADRGAPRQGPPGYAPDGDEYEHRGPPRQPQSRGRGAYRPAGDQYRENRGYQRGGRDDPRRDGYGYGDHGDRPPMTCFNCQGEGHKANDCTEPRKERDGGQYRDDRGFRGGRGDPRAARGGVRERDEYSENPEGADPQSQRDLKQEENDEDCHKDQQPPVEEEKAAFQVQERTSEPEEQNDDGQ